MFQLFLLISLLCATAGHRLQKSAFEMLFPAIFRHLDDVHKHQANTGLTFAFATPRNSVKRTCAQPRCGGSPLVIVPSLIGNQLDATLNHAQVPHFWCRSNKQAYRIWLDLYYLYPGISSWYQSCFWSDLTLSFKAPGQYDSPPGVNITAPYFGGVQGVQFLDADTAGKVPIWAPVIDELVVNGSYVPGKDIVAATYDWRKGPDATSGVDFRNLASLIEQTSVAAGNVPVVLASLSMGGPRAARFLSLQPRKRNDTRALCTHRLAVAWKQQYIKEYVSFSGAFGGSMWSPVAQISPALAMYNISTLQKTPMFEAVRTWGSISYMWPNKNVFDKTHVFVEKDGVNYTASDFVQLASDAGMPNGVGVMKTVTAPQYWSIKPVDVPVTCIYGTNVQTPNFVRFANNWNNITDIGWTVGDGTVAHAGLEQPCKFWNATMVPAPGVPHGAAIHMPQYINVLVKVLGVQ